jgi:hypothetical protein
MDFSSINWLAVIVAGIAAWALGALWYTALFGKQWRAETGMTDVKPTQSQMMRTTVGSLLLMMFMALGLAFCIPAMAKPEVNWMTGMRCGMLMGVFFSAATIGINYLYQNKSMKLFLIDALYQIIFLGIEGAILGAWH